MKQILLHIFLFSSSIVSVLGQSSVRLSGPQAQGQTILACNSILLEPTFSFKATQEESMALIVDPITCDPFAGQPATLSIDQNFIRRITYTAEDGSRYLDQIQYIDGLGRPVQMVQRGITKSGYDLVSLQEYDDFGREGNSWLPAIIEKENGAFVYPASLKSKAIATYGNDSAYSRPVYEASPLNRVLEQYGPGKDWYTNKKAVRTSYQTNISGNTKLNCIHYQAGGTPQNPTLTQKGNYPTGRLYVTEIKDEEDNIAYEFKDKLGQIILTRQMDGTTAYDTYYVYNDYGNRCFVLPPRINDEGITQAKLDELAYLYKYDDRDRCIWKKLPGCEPIYFIYDKADRLIFTQDGEQRKKSEWFFSLPDTFGRIVLTGTCKNALTYSSNPLGAVVANATRTNATNAYKGFTVSGVTLTTPMILSVNYYDNYTFMGYNGIPAITDANFKPETVSGYGTQYTGGYRGLLTGTLTAQQQSDGTVSSAYLYSVMYYDNRGRLIQSKSNNHLSGGIEKVFIAYNFTGQPTQRKHVHSATGKNSLTEVYAYSYDHAGRLLKTTHQLTDGTTVKPLTVLAENTYDELGRLIINQKAAHGNLKTTYTYNVRSWTKSIASPLFSQTLYYNDKVTAHSYSDYKPLYNGNISGMEWSIQSEAKRSYRFKYDNLSRLTHAAYNGVTSGGMYNTSYTYDKHGNMKNLVRRGKNSSAADNNVVVDNLTMTYAGNQLVNVADVVANFTYTQSADFKDKVSPTGTIEYTYNTNGAMTKDLNKGIADIQYNYLNLPRQMVINHSSAKAKNYYTYSASGVKLKTEQRFDPNYNVIPSTTTNPTNDGLPDYKITDYVGNIIYETTKNSTVTTNKTRILVDGGYYEGGVYYFYLTDHLGNNRVVANASGTVIQKNHYYPFGTAFAEGTTAEQGTQPYKYNNKELDQMHGLNLYDYSARMKDDWRFPTVDPLAEKYYSWSPYVYVMNNPLKYTDPTGMYSTEEWKRDNGITDDDLINIYEEPIVLHGPKEPVKYTNSAKNIEYQKGDNIFYIFSHGSTYSVEYTDEKGEKRQATTPKAINNLLSERSPEWKEAMEKGEFMTLIFFSCNVGNEDLNSNPIAKKMSEEYSNLKIYAPNGYAKTMGIIEGYEVGIQQESGGKNNNKNGGFNIYKGGKNVGFEKFTYPNLSIFRKAIFKF